MLDVLAVEAAVFEPEEVGVLADAVDLAIKAWQRTHKPDSDACIELGRLVHNLGRSRLKYNKRLGDAATLAEEAADLMSYLQEKAETVAAVPRVSSAARDRVVTLFPADVRTPPASTLRTV